MSALIASAVITGNLGVGCAWFKAGGISRNFITNVADEENYQY